MNGPHTLDVDRQRLAMAGTHQAQSLQLLRRGRGRWVQGRWVQFRRFPQ